jgi:hypothetical protein
MPVDSPWSIHFQPAGMSTLRNHTGREHWVLHDQRLQPSRLEVKDEGGQVQPVTDRRAVMKFDNTVRKEHFVRVENGGEMPLFQLRIEAGGGEFALGWGPYRVGPLKAGTYTATVIFEARKDRAFDEEKNKDVPVDGALIGTLRSDPVQLRLPLASP